MTILNKVSNKTLMPGITPIADVPDAPTIGTATDAGTGTSVTVAYTAAVTGGTATTFTAKSTPGSFTGTGASPITVSGLTSGTAYTFTVQGSNTTGTGLASAASNSVTPAIPTGFYSIATSAPADNTVSSVTFSGPFTGYNQLQLRVHTRFQAANSSFFITFNGVGGTSYARVSQGGDQGVLGSSANKSISQSQIAVAGGGGTTAKVYPWIGVIDILNPNDTSLNKFVKCQLFTGTNTGSSDTGNLTDTIGYFGSTSVISSITIASSTAANFSNASFALYGVA